MHQLSPTDASFFQLETSRQPMVIGALWICDQSTAPDQLVRHKQILEYVEDRLSHTSLFRRRLQTVLMSLDDPYWIDDANFNLEYHIRHVGLPQPGDRRQLQIFTARIMSRSLDMERAPWELYIIEGLNNCEGFPKNSFAVLLRMHHAYVDGKSALELMSAMMEDTPDHAYGAREPRQIAEPTLSTTEAWARTIPRLASQAYRSTRAGVKVARKGYELYQKLQQQQPDQQRAPDTIFNRNISPHRAYGTVDWDSNELKAIRSLVPGATVNDAIIAIIGGGLRRYLAQRGELPDPDSLIALCPVSIRTDNKKMTLGNMVSGMLISIGSNHESAIERLQQIQKRTARAVPLARDILGDLVQASGEMVPPALRALAGWAQGKVHLASRFPIVNTVITNVPGTADAAPRYFVGAQVLRIYPLVPIGDGVSLTHGITGIGTRIALGVTADRAILPDMDHYLDCLERSTEEYLSLTRQRA